ncbi:MAG: hypothetical protein HFI00_01950 [Lachnospiraceae bacterium]|nr:hypothetical protein [Lachnospiraceae bacterium]
MVGEDLYVYILSFGRYGGRFRGGGEMGGENWKFFVEIRAFLIPFVKFDFFREIIYYIEKEIPVRSYCILDIDCCSEEKVE